MFRNVIINNTIMHYLDFLNETIRFIVGTAARMPLSGLMVQGGTLSADPFAANFNLVSFYLDRKSITYFL